MEIVDDRAWVVFFFQAEDGIRDVAVTGVQTCALPILAFSTILMLEQSEEMFLMSIPKASPNLNPDEARSANSTRYFCSSVRWTMPVTTSPVKLGVRCFFLFTLGIRMSLLFHLRGYSSSPCSSVAEATTIFTICE